MPPQSVRERHPDKTIISYSQIKKYVGCPLQWQLDYALKLAPPSDTIHTIGGTAFHEAVQEWLEVLYGEGAHAAGRVDVKADFKRRIKAEYDKARAEYEDLDAELDVTPGELIEYCEDSMPVIEELLSRRSEFFDPKETELHGIETAIEREVRDGVLFIGFLDVVLKDLESDEYTVIDIKTSTKGWNKFKRQDTKLTNQLAAYKHFFAEDMGVGAGDVKTRFLICQRQTNKWQPRHVSEFVPDTGPERRAEFLGWMEEMLDEGLDGSERRADAPLEPRPEKFRCVWCPFSKTFNGGKCPEGGMDFEKGSYPEGMRPYIDDKWIK